MMHQIKYLLPQGVFRNVLHLQARLFLQDGSFEASDTDEFLFPLPELGGTQAHFRRDQTLIHAVTSDGQAGVHIDTLVAGEFSYLRCQLYRLDTETPTLAASVEYLLGTTTQRDLSSSFSGSDVTKAMYWLDLSSRFIGEVAHVVE